MTVGTLKALLENYPDDMLIGVWKFGSWMETEIVLSHEKVTEVDPNRFVTVDDPELACGTECEIMLVIDS